MRHALFYFDRLGQEIQLHAETFRENWSCALGFGSRISNSSSGFECVFIVGRDLPTSPAHAAEGFTKRKGRAPLLRPSQVKVPQSLSEGPLFSPYPSLFILENLVPSSDASAIKPLSPKTNATTGSLIVNVSAYFSFPVSMTVAAASNPADQSESA